MADQHVFINRATKSPLSVVLIEPDIPQNTGNIARLCCATGAELVLVRPLGFRLTDAALQRAGMDYWKSLHPTILNDLDEFFAWAAGRRVFYLSAHGTRNYAAINYQPGDALVFGSESGGLPPQVLTAGTTAASLITLPMLANTRCINVSSAVAATVYEALRQIYGWSSPSDGGNDMAVPGSSEP
ncbi:MAG TPA: tRNA (cytidine(34)-2'-O)-methyltransferase [Candidatus Rifleibacterium sp.]|nr:tRNA (cytidine(34)-2'-O)-methyltransferase [Candidatus Rifleibacterium sp.]HPT46053.1 tRNA (cytidine(34)-2'-O)-methyltransferase [Candidatus Rifleibacterium sp.]